MITITKRANKLAPLTNAEIDANFQAIADAIANISEIPVVYTPEIDEQKNLTIRKDNIEVIVNEKIQTDISNLTYFNEMGIESPMGFVFFNLIFILNQSLSRLEKDPATKIISINANNIPYLTTINDQPSNDLRDAVLLYMQNITTLENEKRDFFEFVSADINSTP